MERTEADIKFKGSWSGYERDCLFHNPDGPCPRFFNTSYLYGLDFDDDGRACCAVDIDGDGDLDLVCESLQGLRIMENVMPKRHFARLRLTATRGNALALNAVVKLTTGGVTQMDCVKITDGFMTQVPRELHFGLGDAAKVDRVRVQWPSGKFQEFGDLPADRLIEITEGDDKPAVSELKRWPEETRPRTLPAFSYDLALEKFEGGQGPLAKAGSPAVVNFWSTTCAPCKAELPDLEALSKSLAGRVQFAGVSVDAEDPAGAKALASSLGLTFPQFLGGPAAQKAFFGGETQIILPSTFVFDAAGRLQRVFHGAIDAAAVRALLDSLQTDFVAAADIESLGAALLHGSDFKAAEELFRKALKADPNRATIHDRLAVALYGQAESIEGQAKTPEEAAAARSKAMPLWEESIAHLRRAVEIDPDYAEAQYNLGVALQKTGKYEDAVAALQASLRVRPDYYDALTTLGLAAGALERNALAGESFDRAIALSPGRADGYLGKAVWLGKTGQMDAARKCIEKALEADPGNAQAKAMLESMNKR